jgi:NAD(P)-dependent dehydrogenase (short-subunit alcohol dehydrogenase family)
MTTTLITGANKGIGHEVARRLVAEGHDVWIGARDPQAGQAAADELGARFVALDVTDDASVAAAVATVTAAGGLDVLVNNAGISMHGLPTLETDPAEFAAILETNAVGPVRVALAFLPLLEQAENPRIVNVSSSLGSAAGNSDPGSQLHAYPGLDYPTSKAALNLATIKLAAALPRFRVNAVCPGYTATALNDFQGHRTVQQAADVIVDAATVGPDGPTSAYFDENGTIPW